MVWFKREPETKSSDFVTKLITTIKPVTHSNLDDHEEPVFKPHGPSDKILLNSGPVKRTGDLPR